MAFTDQEKSEWKANRMLKTDQVIKRLSDKVKPFAYKVGVWVWVTFKEKPDQETLNQIKRLGFKWSKTRRAWQHPCGVFRTKSPEDPRDKYGIKKITEPLRDESEKALLFPAIIQ